MNNEHIAQLKEQIALLSIRSDLLTKMLDVLTAFDPVANGVSAAKYHGFLDSVGSALLDCETEKQIIFGDLYEHERTHDDEKQGCKEA